MSYEIIADYNMSFILPPNLEDWIPENHPARFIRLFVEQLDLSELGFREHAGNTGRAYYSNDIKLKIWLYGYFHKIRSLRGLEVACCNQIGMIWLIGMHHPDHSTIGNFFNDNKQAIVKLFKESTRLARKAGLIGLVLHALDGTKLKADVCDSKGWRLKDIEGSLDALDNRIDEIVDEIESSIKEEEAQASYHLPDDYKERVQKELKKSLDELKIKQKVREELDKSRQELESIDRKHLHPVDKDARMTKSGFSFNGQAVSDEKSGLIVAQDVVNDEADNDLLVPMIEEVGETIGETAEETVADAGYYSPKQLLDAEEKELDILVNINESIAPKKNKKKFHKSNFTYDEENDVFKCPLGKKLGFTGTGKSRCGKYEERIYRCKSFENCLEREDCSKDKHGRKVALGPHYQALLRQLKKQEIPQKKKELFKRKSIIEKVFGFIKEILGFRRFTVRGLEKVKVQWSLICTTYNLRKLFKVWTEGKLIIGG